MKKEKVLYFEGAGWENADSSKTTDVKNCRIRTAFTNNDGKKIYLEIISYQKTKDDEKKYKRYPDYQIGETIGFIDACFYITDDPKIDDCNKSRLPIDNKLKIKYSLDGILDFVNKYCNSSFDRVFTVNRLGGYIVHTGKHTGTITDYNYGDVFIFDEVLMEKRKEIEKYFYNLEKSEGKQYPNFSLWVDEQDKNLLHLLRHFNGYSKHWSIRMDSNNWKDSIQETKLGKYAC